MTTLNFFVDFGIGWVAWQVFDNVFFVVSDGFSGLMLALLCSHFD